MDFSAPQNGISTGQQVSNTAAPQDFTKSQFKDTNAILTRNRDASMGSITNRLQRPAIEQADRFSTGLDNSGSEYTKRENNRADTTYDAPQTTTMDRAILGGPDEQARTRAGVNPASWAASTFTPDSYNGLDVSKVLNNNDISPIIKKSSNTPYTAGMGALDNYMFRKSGQYGSLQNNLSGLNQDIITKRDSLLDKNNGIQALAQKYGSDAAAKEKGIVTGYLGNAQSGIKTALQKMFDDNKPAVSQQQKQAELGQHQQADKVWNDLQNQQMKLMAELAAPGLNNKPVVQKQLQDVGNAMLSINQMDPKKFINNYNPDSGLGNFASPEQARQYANISSMLGTNDSLYSGSNAGPTVDSTGLGNYLSNLYNPIASDIQSHPGLYNYSSTEENPGGLLPTYENMTPAQIDQEEADKARAANGGKLPEVY